MFDGGFDMFDIDPAAKADGTFFSGIEVELPYEDVVELFGPERKIPLGKKTKHSWTFSGPKGVVTLYDHKTDGTKTGLWHVGCHQREIAMEFLLWLEETVEAELRTGESS